MNFYTLRMQIGEVVIDRFVLAPGANGTELLRMLARWGKPQLSMRIVNAPEIAETALIRCGITMQGKHIQPSAKAAALWKIMENTGYFSAVSYNESVHMSDVLDSLRLLVENDEIENIKAKLGQSEFPEKSAAVISVYEQYVRYCVENGFFDDIMIIRTAIEKCGSINAEFAVLREFPLTPLEKTLALKLSGGKLIETSIAELLGKIGNSVSVKSCTEAYGTENEAENIIFQIWNEHLRLDRCIVACADIPRYSQLFYDISYRFDIPMTFGCGIPVTNSLPAEMLKKYFDWEQSGHSSDALRAMILCAGFDRKKLRESLNIGNRDLISGIDAAGSLRICADSKYNASVIEPYRNSLAPGSESAKYLDIAAAIANYLEAGCADFIRNFAVRRKSAAGRLDAAAIELICGELEAFAQISDEPPTVIIPNILGRNICAENSCEGHLHITGISQAICAVRENLFVAGLSAGKFPGEPSEDHLMLDSEYALFGSNAPTSQNRVISSKNALIDLVRTADSVGSDVRLSYPCYDTAELKPDNASSELFALFRAAFGEDKTFEDLEKFCGYAGFFSRNIDKSASVSEAGYNGKLLGNIKEPFIETAGLSLPERTFSPSDISLFLSCERRFMLSSILGISINEPENMYEVISPMMRGTLIHDLMSAAAESNMPRSELIAAAERCFDEYLLSRPPMLPDDAEREKAEFLRLVQSGYDMNTASGNTVEYSEEPVGAVHAETGIKLKGRLDRAEKKPDGSFVIADFKTGRSFAHTENDTISCIQVLLYAYMLEKQFGCTVSSGEFRYLRYGRIIRCLNDERHRKEADSVLEHLKNCLISGEFERSKQCRFCEYNEICNERR